MLAFHEPYLSHLTSHLRIEVLPDVEKAERSRQRDLENLLNARSYSRRS